MLFKRRAHKTLLSVALSFLTRVCARVCACVWIGGVFVVMFFTRFQLLALVFCALPFLRLLSVIGWFYENWFGARPSEVASAAAAVSLARCKCQLATGKWQVTIVLYSIITHPKLMLHGTVQIKRVVLDDCAQRWCGCLTENLLDFDGGTQQRCSCSRSCSRSRSRSRCSWRSRNWINATDGSSCSGCSSGGSSKWALDNYWSRLVALAKSSCMATAAAGCTGRGWAGSGRMSVVVGCHYERGVRSELMVVGVGMMRQLWSFVPCTMHNHLSWSTRGLSNTFSLGFTKLSITQWIFLPFIYVRHSLNHFLFTFCDVTWIL